jgi:hypothetical protein
MVAAGNILMNCQNAEEAEAMALMEGTSLVARWTRNPMIFVSDCKPIVQEFGTTATAMSRWRGTMHDFSGYASVQPTWKCSFAKRSKNCVAHEVPRYVRQIGVDMVWNSCFPVPVFKEIAFDCNRIYLHIE